MNDFDLETFLMDHLPYIAFVAAALLAAAAILLAWLTSFGGTK
jgi:hypothetical protein